LNLYDVLGEIIATSKSVKAKEISAIIYDKILSSKKLYKRQLTMSPMAKLSGF